MPGVVEQVAAVAARVEGDAMVIRFRSADRTNRITYQHLLGLAGILDDIPTEGLRAVVLGGFDGDFCAGNHLRVDEVPEAWRSRVPAGPHGPSPVVEHHVLRLLWALDLPTVAVLRGQTSGFGLDLAGACDFRLAAEDAVLGQPDLRDTRAGPTGASWLLPRLVGLSQAVRLLLLGDLVDGDEGERIGLVHRSVPASELDQAAADFAAEVAALPTASYAVHKKQVRAQLDLSFDQALEHSLAVRQTHVIEDVQEGIAAWAERRTPRFTGR